MTLRAAALLFFLSLIPGILTATTFEKGDRIHITNIHNIDDDLYGFAQNVTIDGYVGGDLVCGGFEVSTSGEIDGSVNVFANIYRHAGEAKQSLRLFSESGWINGYIGRSLLAFASEIHIEQGAEIGEDADLFGSSVTVDGQIGRNLTVHGSRIYLSGVVNGDVHLYGEKIIISAPATIHGNLTYESTKEAKIDQVGVEILGETKWVTPDDEDAESDSDQGPAIIVPLSQMLAAFLFGIIMLYMFKRYALVSYKRIKTDFAKSFAVGILTIFVMAFSIIILSLSLMGIILGLILSSGSAAFFGSIILIVSIVLTPITSFLSISGGILLYSGGIMMAIFVGSLLFSRGSSGRPPLAKLNLLVGLLIMTLLCAIPYLGTLIFLVAMLTGAGAIVLGVRSCRADSLSQMAAPDLPPTSPPPPIETQPEN
ncbi:MAG: hypothetical protein P1R58_06400 [bacterium]|nr:hypothetical protein [bacterium]